MKSVMLQDFEVEETLLSAFAGVKQIRKSFAIYAEMKEHRSIKPLAAPYLKSGHSSSWPERHGGGIVRTRKQK